MGERTDACRAAGSRPHHNDDERAPRSTPVPSSCCRGAPSPHKARPRRRSS